ncbi:penicillin-binding protein [Williamsia phyllosphaerae]|uniref:Penicillin-binding protein n=1 Tax=Williamsia phyllosphaerae TaxID=885042 RepID=A0ABQ1UBX7_9NOCA|nr:penicillin-binding protein [Williamsia phyllosphaerae]
MSDVNVAVSGRARVAAASVVSGVLVLASCGVFTDAPKTESARMLDTFAAALGAQDASRAAQLTSAPGQAAEQIGATLSGMHAATVSVKVTDPVEYSDHTATYNLTTRYDLGKDREYTTQTTGTARKLTSGWRVQWEPTLLASGMQAGGHLAAVRTDATPAPAVRDGANRPWMALQPVNDIVIDPSTTPDLPRTTRDLARVIAPIAPLITPRVISDRLAAAPGKPVTVVSLRDSDMTVLAGDPNRVAGVDVDKTSALLVTDRRITSPLTAGTTNYWQAIRDATAGWAVQMVAPNGATNRLAGAQGPASPDVRTTLNSGVQLSLVDSVVEVAQPATMLVLDARSGAILAAAANDAATSAGMSLTTSTTPGTTLDPVIAAIDSAAGGDRGAAEEQLHRLGLGVGYKIPGVSMPLSDDDKAASVSAASYNPSSLTVSPVSMGALGVAIARMSSVAPTFVRGVATTVTGGDLGPVDAKVASAIAAAMRKTATSGDASDLTGVSGLRALVGTNGPQGPGWFVGIDGGKVLVVHCAGERSGSAALQVVQKYLRVR